MNYFTAEGRSRTKDLKDEMFSNERSAPDNLRCFTCRDLWRLVYQIWLINRCCWWHSFFGLRFAFRILWTVSCVFICPVFVNDSVSCKIGLSFRSVFNECRKTKTREAETTRRAERRVWANHDRFWFYFWLDGSVNRSNENPIKFNCQKKSTLPPKVI